MRHWHCPKCGSINRTDVYCFECDIYVEDYLLEQIKDMKRTLQSAFTGAIGSFDRCLNGYDDGSGYRNIAHAVSGYLNLEWLEEETCPKCSHTGLLYKHNDEHKLYSCDNCGNEKFMLLDPEDILFEEEDEDEFDDDEEV